MSNTISKPEAHEASFESTLVIEQFLKDNYLFRQNILSGKVEFAPLPEAGISADGLSTIKFQPLTQKALNSIVIHAKREHVLEKGSPKTEITEFLESNEIPVFNPVQVFFDGLPQWDGQNHVARLFSRLPGLSSEQHAFLAIWLRSMAAHWLQLDMLHGNECVPTLIGAQGCGKTTFVRRLLPPEMREYYLDHLNLSNKFDKEMALTNNLIVTNLKPSVPPSMLR